MQIRTLLLASLGATLSGCPSTWNCNPPSEPFDFEDDVTVGQISEMLEARGLEDISELSCDSICAEALASGWEVPDTESCEVSVDDAYDPDGDPESVAASVVCAGTSIEYYCEGRRPLGHVEGTCKPGDPVGQTYAAWAHLEWAAVLAFKQLVNLLESWNAPQTLIEQSQQAMEDEILHARLLTTFARSRGARVPAVRIAPAPQSKAALAMSNATEGCVHEAWSALLGLWRASHAPSDALRVAFTRIAEDETRHAQLSWDLHEWLHTQLSDKDRAAVADARAEAVARLPERARRAAMDTPAGLFPAPGLAEKLATALAERLATTGQAADLSS